MEGSIYKAKVYGQFFSVLVSVSSFWDCYKNYLWGNRFFLAKLKAEGKAQGLITKQCW